MLKRWRGERSFHAHETARMDELNGLPLASFRKRALAYGIDFLIITAAAILLGNKHFKKEDTCAMTLTTVLIMVGEKLRELAESVIYFAVAVKLMKGQTPGKKLMKIRIVSLTQPQIGWWQAIERALGYGASLLEGGFGFFQYYIHPNRMCVHDRIAETIVIDLQKHRTEHAISTDAAELAFEAGAGS